MLTALSAKESRTGGTLGKMELGDEFDKMIFLSKNHQIKLVLKTHFVSLV